MLESEVDELKGRLEVAQLQVQNQTETVSELDALRAENAELKANRESNAPRLRLLKSPTCSMSR
jgi:FtsZ-binding cell division protein ZapB